MSGFRPLLRLGWREARRHRARTTLVGLLIGLPVLVLTGSLVLYDTFLSNEASARRSMGRADGYTDSAYSEAAGDQVPDGARQVRFEVWPLFRTVGAHGRLGSLEGVSGPFEDPMLDGKFGVVDGRLPERTGEAVVSPQLADRIGLRIGSRWRLAVPALSLRIVGLGGDSGCSCDTSVLVGPATFPAPTTLPTAVAEAGYSVTTRTYFSGGAAAGAEWFEQNDRAEFAFAGYGVTAFALVWTGLVAACGLAVGARRRRRELGLLAANGADPARLRLAVIAEGLVIGVVASVLGAVVGTAGATLAVAPLGSLIRRWTVVAEVPWASIAAAPLVGVLAAVVAAAAAARDARRATVGDLLAGRSRPPRPAPRWFAAGAALVLTGWAVAAAFDWAGESRTTRKGLVAGATVLSCTLGLIALSVGAVNVVRGLRGPGVAPRLASRDLSVAGVRSAAAVAVIGLTAAGLGASLVTLHEARLTSEGAGQAEPAPDPSDVPGGTARTVVVVGATGTSELRLVDGTVQAVRSSPGELARWAGWLRDAGLRSTRMGVLRVDGDPRNGNASVRVGLVDDQLSLFTAAARERLESGAILTTWDPSLSPVGEQQLPSDAHVETVSVLPELGVEAVALRRVLDAPSLQDAPRWDAVVGAGRISDRAATTLGRRLARTHGSSADVTSSDPRLWPTSPQPAWIEWAVVGGGGLVTLLVLALVLALHRVESRDEERVLVTAGAPPALRRRLSAWRAGLLCGMGVLPGVIVGVGLVLAATTWTPKRELPQLPWHSLAAVLVGIPLVAAATFAVTTRSVDRSAAAT